jgi:hypothetical protein
MSKWNEWKKNLGDSRPWHLLDPDRKINNKDIIDKRMQSCLGCEFFLQTKQCSKCGCFMPLKTLLSNAECPIGKWGKEVDA